MATFIWIQWPRYLHWWRSCKFPVASLCLSLLFLFSVSLTAHAQSSVLPPILAPIPPLISPPILPDVSSQDADSVLDNESDAIDAAATMFLAVGDIADCNFEESRHVQTAQLVSRLAGDVALLGDLAYRNGRAKEFEECYHPAWGRHNARVRPVPGNHEYGTDGASGYFGYFGATASPLEPDCRVNCKGYYSYNVGYWHVIALNSERSMAAGSEQEKWLRADIAAHRTQCTIAYWHHPRFSSGAHKIDIRSHDVWVALYEAGVDVVLNGHDHNYERFEPQNPDGEIDAERGIRQFVVGTGGIELRPILGIASNSVASNSESWGVLQLALYYDHYDWEFQSITGQTYSDNGSAPCVHAKGDWESRQFLPLLIDDNDDNKVAVIE